MLYDLHGEAWHFVVGLAFVTACIYGYMVDGLMGSAGFGPFKNAGLILAGGFAALFFVDWLMMRHVFSPGRMTPFYWVSAFALGGTVLLFMVALLREFAASRLANPWVATVAVVGPAALATLASLRGFLALMS